ncbi:protein WHAT'S THIS FACTOR 1 homolog, chloroplastic [Cornus florida]|uniref:protein WHAT'S THIS FACTOR 1 homolog, chloroplastic n=1 Tax=Cornus florida TaxID=4283 RepID=UPI0028A21312|nr:protein WHAT'S THIS FACTOR 1 homolog, chloroplastic [Cornus florida]
MRFILHYLSIPHRQPHHHHSRRAFVDIGAIKLVRDRALDHAVEKENHLKPMLNLKNLIKSEPSKSLPLSIIVQNRKTLEISLRPIEFVRKFPSVFEEFLPGGAGIHPHVKLTPEVLELDAEEELIYQSDNYKQQVADRLLKVLMLTRIHKIPLHIIDRLKWDLGLPQDYTQTIVPEFPDYFQVTGDKGSILELVCWSNELAVSVIEKKTRDYEKGMPIAFPSQNSRGFEMDKNFKKWVDEWQKLPYISPYENASHLLSKSDESDKWAVAVLHELLHLLVSKKTERENLLCLGEYLGIRSRFKIALLHHPGIFYISSRIRTHTAVLKEAYKRALLIEKHPLMDMRYKYIHLMNMEKKDHKPKSLQGSSTRQQKASGESKEGEVEDDGSGGEQEQMSNGLSDSEFEDDSDDNCSDYDEEDDEDESETLAYKNMATNKGRTTRKRDFEEKGPMRTMPKRSFEGKPRKSHDKKASKFSRRTETRGGHDFGGNSLERSDARRTMGRSKYDNCNDFDDAEDGNDSEALAGKNMETNKGRTTRKRNFEEKGPMRTMPKRSFEGNPRKSHDKKASKFSRRTEMRGGHDFGGNSLERSDAQRTGGRSKYDNCNDFDDEKDEDNSEALARKNMETNRGRTTRKMNFEEKGPMRTMPKRSFEGKPRKFSRRIETRGGHDFGGNSLKRSGAQTTTGRSKYAKRTSTW